MTRGVVNIAVILSLIFLPWWTAALFAFVALFYFKSYYEIIFIGLALDFLYGTPHARILGIGYFYTVFAAAFFVLSLYLREKLFVYSR